MPQYVQQEQYTPFVRPYIEGPVKEYDALQKQLIQDYDETAAQYDALQEAKDNMKYVNYSEADKARVQALMAKAESAINQAAKEGDYENRARIIRREIANFKTGYAPVFEKYQQDMKARQAILERTDINDPNKRQELTQLLTRRNQDVGPIKYDKNGLPEVQPFRTYVPVKDIPIDEKLAKILSLVREHKFQDLPYLSPNQIERITKKGEYLGKDELQRIGLEYAKNDPEIQAYLNQEAELFAVKTSDDAIPNEVKEKYYQKFKPESEEEEARLNEMIKMDMFKNQKINRHVINTSDIFDINNVFLDSEYTPEHEAFMKAQGEANFKETLTTLGQGTTEITSSSLFDRQNQAKQLKANAANIADTFVKTASQYNIPMATIGAISNIMKSMPSSGNREKDLETAITKAGLNLTPEQKQILPQLIADSKAYKRGKLEADNVEKQIQSIQKTFAQKQGIDESYLKPGSIFNTALEQLKGKESVPMLEVGNLSSSIVAPVVQRIKKLNPNISESDALVAAQKMLKEAADFNKNLSTYLKENKDLTSTGYLLINPDKGSLTGKVAENLTYQYKATPETMMVNGKQIRQYLSENLGISDADSDGNSITITGDVIPYVNRIGGKDKGRVTVQIKNGDKVIKEVPVDIDLHTNAATMDDLLSNAYKNAKFNKMGDSNKFAQTREQVQGNIAKGYAERKISNLEDLYDLEATSTKSVNLFGTNDNVYSITKEGRAFRISIKGKDSDTKQVKTFRTDQLNSLEEVKEYLGKIELQDTKNILF